MHDDSQIVAEQEENNIDEFIREYNQKNRQQITKEELLRRPTLRNLARFNNGNLQFKNVTNQVFLKDLSRFVEPKNKVISSQKLSLDLKNILVTGATGFLGIHLLSELYRTTSAKIYVLIKAASKLAARHKLHRSFQDFKLSDLSQNARIEPILGDLSARKLAIVEQEYHFLEEHLDAIYHVAAFVHHIYDYISLRSVNVAGTHELVDLAFSNKIKYFYYISSIIAASKQNSQGTFLEEVSDDKIFRGKDGYAQTKFASEYYLMKASQQGLPVTILRPSNISGRSTDQVCKPEKNHFLSLVKGCIQMQLVPNWIMNYNLVPVDYVASLISHASLSPQSGLRVFNIVNSHELDWNFLINWLNSNGYQLETCLEDEWSEKYLPFISRDNALFPFISLYSNRTQVTKEHHFEYNPSSNKNIQYASDNTKKILKDMGFEWPKMDPAFLESFFAYLQKIKFMPLPNLH